MASDSKIMRAAKIMQSSVLNYFGIYRNYLPKRNPRSGRYWPSFDKICTQADKLGLEVGVYIDSQVRCLRARKMYPAPNLMYGKKAEKRMERVNPHKIHIKADHAKPFVDRIKAAVRQVIADMETGLPPKTAWRRSANILSLTAPIVLASQEWLLIERRDLLIPRVRAAVRDKKKLERVREVLLSVVGKERIICKDTE